MLAEIAADRGDVGDALRRLDHLERLHPPARLIHDGAVSRGARHRGRETVAGPLPHAGWHVRALAGDRALVSRALESVTPRR